MGVRHGLVDVRLEQVAEALELNLALIADAEGKSLLGRVGVKLLELWIVFEHLEARAVALPKEAQPLDIVVPAETVCGATKLQPPLSPLKSTGPTVLSR